MTAVPSSSAATAFAGHCLLHRGSLVDVAHAVKRALESAPADPILVFDDATGRVVDLDLRGTPADIAARLPQAAPPPPPHDEGAGAKGRGRPKLGVVAREVTLLPRHWDWLATQPGGASAVLRRLVDEARKAGGSRQERRSARDAAYHFMQALAGDLPGYEEATRSLFADDRDGLERRIADWPPDVRTHALRLAYGPEAQATPA